MFGDRITRFLAVAVCMLVFGAGPARAALITIEIEAVVDYVEDRGPGDGYLDGMIGLGDIITGFYTYESTTPDTNPLERAGRYEHTTPPHGIFLSVGGFDFQTNPASVDFVIAIENDHPPDDNYFLLSGNNLPLSNGAPLDEISWLLNDPTGSALSSAQLPITAPVLSEWESNILMFGADRLYGITAHVTSAIPEPATIILLGMGGLFLRKRG